MMAASSVADQLAKTKALRVADIAARNARTATNNQIQRDRAPIPIYGVGKGMDLYYAPGQTPGASRTEANGREQSGTWDPRHGYVPTNWQRPQSGQVLEQDGSIYVGRETPEWGLPASGMDPVRRFKQARYGFDYGNSGSGPSGVGPLPVRPTPNVPRGTPPLGWTPPATSRSGPAFSTNRSWSNTNFGAADPNPVVPGGGGGSTSPGPDMTALKRALMSRNVWG